jgi:hypothetical protein
MKNHLYILKQNDFSGANTNFNKILSKKIKKTGLDKILMVSERNFSLWLLDTIQNDGVWLQPIVAPSITAIFIKKELWDKTEKFDKGYINNHQYELIIKEKVNAKIYTIGDLHKFVNSFQFE